MLDFNFEVVPVKAGSGDLKLKILIAFLNIDRRQCSIGCRKITVRPVKHVIFEQTIEY